jgi:hypothetical protein
MTWHHLLLSRWWGEDKSEPAEDRFRGQFDARTVAGHGGAEVETGMTSQSLSGAPIEP